MKSVKPILSRLGSLLLKIGAGFVILEPIWMLLPFAGFLYGSVLRIESLSENPRTAWLVHFIFPVHTLFPLGLILILAGFLIFLVGAFQIYSAKLLKKGMVRRGIYRKFRHPQYLALSVFCLGIILTWGRFITFIAFFIMLWLYYLLSKSEERKCREAFGEQYEEYRQQTWFLLPGERFLVELVRRLPKPRRHVPGWIVVLCSFLLVVGFSIGAGFGIQWIKSRLRHSIPALEGVLTLTDEEQTTVPLLMVKGPALQASPLAGEREVFMAKLFDALRSSEKISSAVQHLDLGKLDISKDVTLLAFLTPGPDWFTRHHREFDVARVNVFLLVLKTPVHYDGDNFVEFRKNWRPMKVVRAYDMSYGNLERGEDPVAGRIETRGPPPNMAIPLFRNRMEERVDFFLSGL